MPPGPLELVYRREAVQDLNALFDYIAADRPLAAQRFLGEIRRACEGLRWFPMIGRQLDPDDPAVQQRLEDEIGDLLFVAANLARHAHVDVGSALRRANRKFERRFRAMEALSDAEGMRFSEQPLEAQETYWARVKAAE